MYMYVNKRVELAQRAQRGIALQKRYVILFIYYYYTSQSASQSANQSASHSVSQPINKTAN